MNAVVRFAPPASGFDDPVGLWLACHERVRRFSALLVRLSQHVATHGADAEAQQAAASIRRYFNEAAPRHHEDEELDLFPLLREKGCTPQVATALERVEDEHPAMGADWRALEVPLARIARGEAAALPADAVARFGAAYEAHIAVEEGTLLPAMRAAFDAADWQRIGAAMAERRGIVGHAG